MYWKFVLLKIVYLLFEGGSTMASYILGKINIDDEKLKRDLEIHNEFPKIAEEYDEFGTGFWQNCTLWSWTSDELNTMYKDYDYPIQQTR